MSGLQSESESAQNVSPPIYTSSMTTLLFFLISSTMSSHLCFALPGCRLQMTTGGLLWPPQGMGSVFRSVQGFKERKIYHEYARRRLPFW